MADNKSLKDLLNSGKFSGLDNSDSIQYNDNSSENPKPNSVGTLYAVHPSALASTPRSNSPEGAHIVQKV